MGDDRRLDKGNFTTSSGHDYSFADLQHDAVNKNAFVHTQILSLLSSLGADKIVSALFGGDFNRALRGDHVFATDQLYKSAIIDVLEGAGVTLFQDEIDFFNNHMFVSGFSFENNNLSAANSVMGVVALNDVLNSFQLFLPDTLTDGQFRALNTRMAAFALYGRAFSTSDFAAQTTLNDLVLYHLTQQSDALHRVGCIKGVARMHRKNEKHIFPTPAGGAILSGAFASLNAPYASQSDAIWWLRLPRRDLTSGNRGVYHTKNLQNDL